MQQVDSGELDTYCLESITYNEFNEPSRKTQNSNFVLCIQSKSRFQI